VPAKGEEQRDARDRVWDQHWEIEQRGEGCATRECAAGEQVGDRCASEESQERGRCRGGGGQHECVAQLGIAPQRVQALPTTRYNEFGEGGSEKEQQQRRGYGDDNGGKSRHGGKLV
jgi:hypothetical protein